MNKKSIALTLILILPSLGILWAQTDLDSLHRVWLDESQPDSLRVEAYGNYLFFTYGENEVDSLILYANELYRFSQERGLRIGLRKAAYNLGYAYYRKGQYATALRYLRESEKLTIKPHSGTLILIGAIYGQVSDTAKLIEYWEKSLEAARLEGTKGAIAGSLINIGIIYRERGRLDTAMSLTKEGIKLARESGMTLFAAHGVVNIARIYRMKEEYDSSFARFQRAQSIYEDMGYQPGVATAYVGLGVIYTELGDFGSAEENCSFGYEAALSSDDLETQLLACQCLYAAYKALGNGDQALKYHELMIVLKDSFKIDEAAKKLQQMEFQQQVIADSLMQVEEKRKIELEHQKEVRKKNRTRNFLFGGGLLTLIFAGGLWSRLRYVRRSKAIIENEKNRSENLLLNILPAEIAQELKEKGRAEARDFDTVSILFTDFKGFTEGSAKLSASELVFEINHCFERFDRIIEKYEVEKIKTIGDAYMAAGGLPVQSDTSVKNTVLAALEMQEFIEKRKAEMDAEGKPAFRMRVGVHTGPVVAGIVGVKKFQYDIWGDTVNTASRIESNGQAGKVNISSETYGLLKEDPDFTFSSRGKIDVKGKGEMEMWFVDLKKSGS